MATDRTMPGALIVGGAHVSLGIARSLGRRGIPVWLLANHPLPKFSRYIKRSFDWCGADHAHGLQQILDIAANNDLAGWVLIPTGDQDLRLISQNRSQLSATFRVAAAEWETVQWAYDKRLTHRRARSLGIDVPWSFEPQNLDDVRALDCRFPVILKPAYRKGVDAFTLAKAWKAENRDMLIAFYRDASSLVGADAVIVQEWIPGTGSTQFSCAGLWERGEPLALMTARRSRQHPIDFGRSSTFVETIVHEEIEDAACRFMRSLAYSGVAEVEFKYDARERRFKLLDVNARFWTWCGLGGRAGVDFPHLGYLQALGHAVETGRARPGVAWMHTRSDVKAVWEEMRRGSLSLRDYIAGFRQPLTFANFAADDPLPALMEIPAALLNRLPLRKNTANLSAARGRLRAAK